MKKQLACAVRRNGRLGISEISRHEQRFSRLILRWAGMVAIAIWLILPATARSQLTINLVDGGGAAPGTPAGDAFRAAADTWEATLLDDVTLTIEVRLGTTAPSGGAFPTGARGASSKPQVAVAYGDNPFSSGDLSFLDAIAADSLSITDASVVATLPNLLSTLACCTSTQIIPMRRNIENGGIAFLLDPDATNVGDGADSINNFNVILTQANAKALGITMDIAGAPINDPLDGIVALNSAFAWDFDPGDGLTGSDFFGTALHEIGHVLGFASGVGLVGCAADPSCNLNIAIDDGTHVTSLDLLRYSSASVALGVGVIDSAVGGAPYFSIDGGATNLGRFSSGTSSLAGDGRQAEHWVDVPDDPADPDDGVPLGLMNPTSADPLGITALDITAFDAIGWDVVPRPQTTAAGFDVMPIVVPIPALSTQVFGINEGGTVAGSYRDLDGILQGFTMLPSDPIGTFNRVGLIQGDDDLLVTDINDEFAGELSAAVFSNDLFGPPARGVARLCFPLQFFVFFCEPRTVDIPSATGDVIPSAINQSGIIGGSFSDAAGEHGFLADASVFPQVITQLDFPGAQFTRVGAVADDGDVGGQYFDGSQLIPFLFDGSNYSSVAIPGATVEGHITGINAADNMTALTTTNPLRTTFSGRFFDGAVWTSIGISGASSVIAWGLNDANQIVGAFRGSAGRSHGFIATPLANNTQAGMNVIVQPGDPGSGESPVRITFEDVTGEGDTTLVISSNGPPAPAGYDSCDPATYYTVDTTAQTSAGSDIEVCIDLADLNCGTAAPTIQVADSAGMWTDVTTSTNGEVCGDVNDLGTFSVFALTAAPSTPGDADGDGDIDRDDIMMIFAARNQPASGPDDPRDIDGDGVITVLDARQAILMCTLPGCASP